MILKQRSTSSSSLKACLAALALPALLVAVSESARADAGGRFPIPELPSGTTITIDDENLVNCSDADWPMGAGQVLAFNVTPITGPSGSGKLLISHPNDPLLDEEIYVFATIQDSTSNKGPTNFDDFVLMFDLSHDHLVANTVSFDSSDDRGIRFRRDGSVERVFGNVTNPTVSTALPSVRTCVSEPNASSWNLEARILPADLGLNSVNALMGAAVLASDWNFGAAALGRWPSTVTANPNTWTNLLTRPPIDYVLLVDQSGSMAGDKWNSAKQAGNNFTLVLSKLIDDELNSEYTNLEVTGGGDRLGMATFTWSTMDDSAAVVPLGPIPSNPGNYTGVLPASPGGWTPIAGGINKTFEMFGGAGNLANPVFADPQVFRTRVVMLLSDGLHNRQYSNIDFDNSGGPGEDSLAYVPTPNCLNNNPESLVRINTVAIGTDTTVSTSMLDNIKGCYSGEKLTNIYNITSASEAQLTAQLTKFFVETLLPYYHWNLLNTNGANFTLKAGERRLLLFAFWANKADAMNGMSITKPDMTVESATVDNGKCDSNLGYCYIFLDHPAAGSYANFSAPSAIADGKFVLLDLRVESLFAIDNQPHGTASTITLRARLREDGQPILGADVRVDVARPEEGFGTVVSTHSPEDCSLVTPKLPGIGDTTHQVITGGKFFGSTVFSPVAGATTGQGADPPGPRFSLMDQILKACGKKDLDRSEDPGLKLFDDGSHGDAVADDGFYTLSFTNTDIEGSYVFRFRASGTTADGLPFDRVKEIAEYVRIDVDPAHTDSGSRILQSSGNLVWKEYYVLPRDFRGQYLGPGYADQVEFLKTGGQWATGIIDYNNGYYSRVLQYDSTVAEPDVTPVVQGKPIGLRGRGFELVVPYVGITFFDSALGLDNGPVVGARLGYRFTERFVFELEGGATFTETALGDEAVVIQAMGNFRFYFGAPQTGAWGRYVTAGFGAFLFRGFGADDEAWATQAGFGAVYHATKSLGLQLEGRVFRLEDALGAGSTTSTQATVGLFFNFD